MTQPSKKIPFFSIIIPTRNEEQRLKYCLPSLLAQTYKNFEILIIEDPETSDNTKEYIDILNDKRIKYIVHKKGIKVPAKRNIGAASAHSKYLYFMDADMEMPKDLLKSIVDQLKENKSDLMFVKERTPGDEWLSRMKDFEKQVIQKEISLLAARIYKKELFYQSGGYNEDLIVNEEVELSDRLLEQGRSYSFSNMHINHFETSGANLVNHLKKKFKYGTTARNYFDNKDESKSMASKRSGSSRLIYFTSPKVWQNPVKGIQFIVFKKLEIGAMILGLIYSKIKKTNTINTK